MPFVVPGQQSQQPQQQRSGRGGGMERRDYASQQPVPQPQYQSRPQPQQGRGGGMDPWEQQRQRQYRQPQTQYQPQRGGYQQQPQYRDPYGQRGGGRQYQQPQYQPPQQRGYDSYGRQPQRQYSMGGYQDDGRRYAPATFPGQAQGRGNYQADANARAANWQAVAPSQSNNGNREALSNAMSNRPQQGTYVGEGVYADGTPMPSSGYSGQSLIQSNGAPQGGVYGGDFNATPDVIGGITPRAYYEEDETYNKPMRVGRGQGGLY